MCLDIFCSNSGLHICQDELANSGSSLFMVQDVEKWGEYASRGRPTGNGCYLCVATVAEAFPKMTWTEASATFHDKKQTVWKAAFLAAKDVKRKIVEGELPEPFQPPSSVSRNQVRSVIVFVEMAFVTEADLARLFQLGSKSLGLGKGVRMQIEDGTFLNGWLINLRGMPSRELMSLRRVRMEMRADVTLTEEILQSIHQLRQEQGQDLWEVACEKQDSVVAQGSVSSKSRQRLHTIESLQARADQVLQDSWANPTTIIITITVSSILSTSFGLL